MGLTAAVSNGRFGRVGLRLAAALLSLQFTAGAWAQSAVQGTELLALPQPRHLAAALSDPDSRVDTLLTLLAVKNLKRYGKAPVAGQFDALATRFREERAWLDRLASRYEELPMRASLFDPAAWYLLLQLDQYGLKPGTAVSPLGPDTASLLEHLFDRSNEPLAASVLPELLTRIEIRSTGFWQETLDEAARNEPFRLLLLVLESDWFDPWSAAEPPAPELESDLLTDSLAQFREIAGMTLVSGPPDALNLKRLRYGLLAALPGLDEKRAADAARLLRLANAFDGLYRQHYLSFTELLLRVAAELLMAHQPSQDAAEAPPTITETTGDLTPLENLPEEPVTDGTASPSPYVSQLPRLLSDLLPAVSNAYATEFTEVDPRINSALAEAYDVMQYFTGESMDPERYQALRSGLANTVVQLTLLIPDMNYYYDQPVRRTIDSQLQACIALYSAPSGGRASPVGRGAFESCMSSLAESAARLTSAAELAGDPDGPFGVEQLRRELLLTPYQRINFVLGYLQEHYPAACVALAEPLPNPLEWSSLVTTITWLARESPVFFQAPENEARLATLREQGRTLLAALAQRVDCISGSGSGLNDPVARGLADYRTALSGLIGGLREAELAFREERLQPGADVVLDGDASQSTAYRPENLKIGPCDARYVCEMRAELDATRALVDRFPDPYLLADQSGLGQVEICYDNVQWVGRRSEPVREDDPHVANYFGRLSFDLIGRYREGETVRNVFGYNFVSPDEYHYLFAAASEEVLQDRCPMEWVGTRIVTPLGSDSQFRVVPDRLTYLAAARSLPSRLMISNWDRNQQWRDAFILGRDVRPQQYEGDPDLAGRIDQHLQGLYRSEQAALYNALLRPPQRSWRDTGDSLYDLLSGLSANKDLLRNYLALLYPSALSSSDGLRGSLEGYDALLDAAVLRRFRRDKVAVSALQPIGMARLGRMQARWDRQPDGLRRSGSVPVTVAHALARLDSLYEEFFGRTSATSSTAVFPGG